MCFKRAYWMALTFLTILSISPLAAETPASLRGRVTDPSGAVVPGAVVLLRMADGKELKGQTNESGTFEFRELVPGNYQLLVTKEGFTPYENLSLQVDKPSSLNIALEIAAQEEHVTIQSEAPGVTTDPSQNAGALVLKEKDLEALSDDPDELSDELQALAGPGAGPNGGQVFIDGFTGGRLPAKSAIREVRINRNPYSAEYDHIGFGRVEILTKPGADKLRGNAFFNYSDDAFNSRNPFVPNKPPYAARLFGGRIGGPLNKKSSFSLDIEGRSLDENAVVNATVLNSQFQIVPYQVAVVTPQLRLNIAPRLDYQLTEKNTLVVRYQYSPIRSDNLGVTGFTLPTQSYDSHDAEHTVQVTETAVLSPRAINETRFQYQHTNITRTPANSDPSIIVLDSFNGGGTPIGLAYQFSNSYEFQNYTSYVVRTHSFKFGGRVRSSFLDDHSPNNFNGTFSFAGGTAPVLDSSDKLVLGSDGQPVLAPITSIQRYQRTLVLQNLGLSAAQIRLLGGGASQFTLNAGEPLTSVSQTDVGLFGTWDWQARPRLTLSAGLRWEDQTNISSHLNIAPRLGVAWALDGKNQNAAKTVLRWGGGLFYSRVDENLTLQADRYNGVTQTSYLLLNPNFFPNIPSLEQLSSFPQLETVRRLDNSIVAPYLIQTSIGIERQLPRNSTLAVNYIFSRGVHLLRIRDINAPGPDGVRPQPDISGIFQYESTGFSRQNQLIANFNTRFSKRVTLFGFYSFSHSYSDTDGANTFPADPYNFHTEWGPSAYDVHHRMVMGGSFKSFLGITLNPFVVASSGVPFNIITGRDLNGDGQFTDRPAFAGSAEGANVISTPWGDFLINPKPGDPTIPRNYGRGTSLFLLNMRVGRTFGFGGKVEGAQPTGPTAPGFAGGPFGVRRGGGRWGEETTNQRYNLTFSVQARNLLNHVNLAPPVGNLSSPLFGESTQIAGGFGGATAANRRIELQLRFSF
ncbi:MAG TPA: carboxypeptidase regulatory-like domain-containing protein [Terriglobia bacterium]|nr:carboxypeptidase regulatory-like domain-containing protein [Terriglobia bacterium]